MTPRTTINPSAQKVRANSEFALSFVCRSLISWQRMRGKEHESYFMSQTDFNDWDVLVGRVKGRWDHAKLRVQPFSKVEGRFAPGAILCAAPVEGPRRLLTVRESFLKNEMWICDCDLRTVEEAEALVRAEVFVDASMRPELGPNEFYADEMIGMHIVTEAGEDLGAIEEILESPANDVYVTAQAMVPDVPEWIVRIDGEKRAVIVRDDPGLRN